MIFGTYELERQPNDMTKIQKDLSISYVLTLSSADTFSYGTSYVGKKIDIYWNYMPTEQYEDLYDLYIAGDTIEFDPEDGEEKTFNVKILSLDCKYLVHLDDDTNHKRQNIKLELLILSEAS